MKFLIMITVLLGLSSAHALDMKHFSCISPLMTFGGGYSEAQATALCQTDDSSLCVNSVLGDKANQRQWSLADLSYVAAKVCQNVSSDTCIKSAIENDGLTSIQAAGLCKGMKSDACFEDNFKANQPAYGAVTAQLAAVRCE